MSDNPPERHPTLYFPNGDVVLSALIDGAPPRTQLFRVHKFLLMHHSTTFANMFADANPASGESYDGVPIVELHGDRSEDFALLLNYLYNPTQMTFKRFDPNTPLIVSGVIRLADKYGIENLREHLIKVVASDWPTTLKEWDVFEIEVKAVKEKLAVMNDDEQHSEDLHCLRDHIPEPAAAIVFAHEFGCHQILPAAYYQLSTIEPNHDWNFDEDSSVPCARWELLSKDSLLRYVRGSNRLLARHPTEVDFLSSSCYPNPDAWEDYQVFYNVVAKPHCPAFFKYLIGKVRDFRPGPSRNPLRFLSQCLEYYNSGEGRQNLPIGPPVPCCFCELAIRGEIPEMRFNIWAEVPRYFDIEVLS